MITEDVTTNTGRRPPPDWTAIFNREGLEMRIALASHDDPRVQHIGIHADSNACSILAHSLAVAQTTPGLSVDEAVTRLVDRAADSTYSEHYEEGLRALRMTFGLH